MRNVVDTTASPIPPTPPAPQAKTQTQTTPVK
jgi:hypothetical protein